jgi:flagellar basal-body rod modification protein FlgD
MSSPVAPLGSPAQVAGAFAPAAPAASSANSSGVGQADFLKLLMAQMSHQDPSSPTSATDYVTQMAQFSSVQGINQLNQSITSLLVLQGLTQGVGLIGKTVTYTNAAGKSLTGTVGSIAMVGGLPQLVINNSNVSLSQVQSIQPGPKAGPSATHAGGSSASANSGSVNSAGGV